MSTWIKDNGSWKEVTSGSIKVNGVWVNTTETFIKINGKWENVNTLPISFEMEVEATAKPTFADMKGKLMVTDLTGGKYNVKGYGNIQAIKLKDTSITKAVVKNISTLAVFDHMFEGCTNLTSIIFEQGLKYKTTINSIYTLAKDCSMLTHVDVSALTGCKIAYSGGAFGGCETLVSIDLSVFDFSADGLDAGSMFDGCTKLTKINMGVNGEKAKLLNMFKDCNALRCFNNLNTIGNTGNPRIVSSKLVNPDAATLVKLNSSAGFKYEKGSAC